MAIFDASKNTLRRGTVLCCYVNSTQQIKNLNCVQQKYDYYISGFRHTQICVLIVDVLELFTLVADDPFAGVIYATSHGRLFVSNHLSAGDVTLVVEP